MANTIIRGGSSTRVIIEPPSLFDVLASIDALKTQIVTIDTKITAVLGGGVVVPPVPTVLGALSLAAASIQEASVAGTVIGGIIGRTTGSTLSLVDTIGGRFALSGTNLVAGTTPLDYEAATTYQVTVRETLAGATNSPRDTLFNITVINVFEVPPLGALSFANAGSLRNGTTATGAIAGATAGSAIIASGLPAGFTINGPARTWAFDGTTPAGTTNVTLTETLGDSSNSPRSTALSVTVLASPVFTRSPAITTDGSPQVGEVAAFDFGDGTGAVTSRLLRTDNSTITLADASVGSYQWQTAGSYRLEVTRTLNGGTVTQFSAAVSVTAAAASTRSAPVLSFPTTNDDGTAYTTSTNPPVVQFSSTDSSINKNTDSFEYSYTSNGVSSGTRTIALSDLVQREDQYFAVPGLDTLNAGPFSFGPSRFTGPGDPSPNSNVLSATLAAKSLPAATTTFDELNKSQYATLSSDKRTVSFTIGVNSEQPILSTTSRSDKRFIEFIPTDVPDDATNRFLIGIAPANATIDPSKFVLPAGAVTVEVPIYDGTFRSQLRAAIADNTASFTTLFVPATSGNNGTLEVLFKGNRVGGVVSHSLMSAKALFDGYSAATVRMNAGQDAFRYSPDSSYVRWN